ncbi:unnamed protein product [Ceutorhynchus assimilis]|uniref:Uncharacterized protein n=1 Tax=Ceutorhynchus assimilis TaxID=467358 RepID=A0A9N9MCH1_9CUCU|nr:unnamed protein product [Ceutorhynchus assimilis]
MSVESILFILIVYISFNLINSYEDDWSLFENSFIHHNREEIFISNVTTDEHFKLNFTVAKWATLNAGPICYTGGITNNGSLIILFSTLSSNGTGIAITEKIYDLEDPITNIEFIEERKNGNQSFYIIAYSPKTNNFIWYTLKNFVMNKIWTWHMEEPISYFSSFKINKDPFLIVSTLSRTKIYRFKIDTLEYWIHQSIQLGEPTNSLCLTQTEANFYLSITQPSAGLLLIYKSSNQHFNYQESLTSNQLNQVICFENGFKSFVAFNGHDAGIYEFTKEGLESREIVNSNLEGIQFWLSVPIDIYRDESLLFCQRKLDHDKHEDIPCSLHGDLHNNLKCLTEFDSHKGMLSSSYIRVANHLALIVSSSKNSSILFNLKVGLKKIDHPAKKELELFQDLKKELEIIIAEQKIITKKLKKQESRDAPLLQAKLDWKNEAANVLNELDDVNREFENYETLKLKGKYDTVIFNGPVVVKSALITTNFITEDPDIVKLLNNLVRKDHLEPIQGLKTFTNLSVHEMSFENLNNISKNEFLLLNDEINGNIVFENEVAVGSIELLDGVVNDVEIDKWVNVDKPITDPITFEQVKVRNKFETQLLNDKHISQSTGKLFIPGNVTVENLNGRNFEDFLRKLCIDNATCHLTSLKLNGGIHVKGNANIKRLNTLQFPEDYIDLEPKKKLTISGKKEFTNITRGYKATEIKVSLEQ